MPMRCIRPHQTHSRASARLLPSIPNHTQHIRSHGQTGHAMHPPTPDALTCVRTVSARRILAHTRAACTSALAQASGPCLLLLLLLNARHNRRGGGALVAVSHEFEGASDALVPVTVVTQIAVDFHRDLPTAFIVIVASSENGPSDYDAPMRSAPLWLRSFGGVCACGACSVQNAVQNDLGIGVRAAGAGGRHERLTRRPWSPPTWPEP
jgi:hypothetical protein